MRRLPVLFFLILSIPLAAPAEVSHVKFTRHYKNSLFKVTENGRYSVELIAKGNLLKVGQNTLDVIVHDDKNRDIVGAEVRVVQRMPDMGHGVDEKPVVKEQGGGLYRVENVILTMAGHWQLGITVKKDGVEDAAVLMLPRIAASHEDAMHQNHQHGKSMDMGKLALDTSTVKNTAHFRVAFISEASPIPVNTLHTWKLKVTTPQGKPVKGATIEIEGDMPAHGHGLPTKPEATRESADGVYLIEGMKFSMAGHWVMKFHIAANGSEDTAAFDLLLK